MRDKISMPSQLPVLVFKMLAVNSNNSKHNKIHDASTNQRHCTLVPNGFWVWDRRRETT